MEKGTLCFILGWGVQQHIVAVKFNTNTDTHSHTDGHVLCNAEDSTHVRGCFCICMFGKVYE